MTDSTIARRSSEKSSGRGSLAERPASPSRMSQEKPIENAMGLPAAGSRPLSKPSRPCANPVRLMPRAADRQPRSGRLRAELLLIVTVQIPRRLARLVPRETHMPAAS